MLDLGRRVLWAAAVSSLLFLSSAEARVPGGTTEVDLGTHSPGARLMTAVAAHNVSCKGRHDFELVVRDAPWLTPAGSSDLKGIRKGKRKSTNVVVDTTGLEPGTHRGRIEVRCITCPSKCHQDRTSLDVVVAVRGGTGDPGDPLGEDGESDGSGSPYRFDPRNPENPFDSYGELHNAMLDQIAADRHLLETAGVVLPSRLAGYVAERACDNLDAALGSSESCTEGAFIQIASISMVAEVPLSHLFDIAGFSPEQRADVHAIEAAISLAFARTDPNPEVAIDHIKGVEERIQQRANISALPRSPLPCPDHWPPPCHWHCPLGPDLCVPLPPLDLASIHHPIDQAILAASSVARHSISYWSREISGDSADWAPPGMAGETDFRRTAKGYDGDKLARSDFSGALWGAAEGFVGGLILGALSGPGALGSAVGGALLGSVTGMVFSSAREAASQFGWW